MTGADMDRLAASFRDPSGFMFHQAGALYRQVNQAYRADYDHLMTSGLYERLVEKGMLIPHREVEVEAPLPALCYRVIQPEPVAFISYPYEWSFTQLQDAALLTLALQREALQFGMTLKDASAYNIQFHEGRPVLIDTLSFARYQEGQPWIGYRQFCQHFLAPLALMSKVDLRLGRLSTLYIDGIPLDLTSALLPWATRFNLGLFSHLHMHARSEKLGAASEARAQQARQVRVNRMGLLALLDNLESTVRGLKPHLHRDFWADYYANTNYTEATFALKKRLVADMVREVAPRLVWDLGANTGLFSRVAAEASQALVIAADIDPEAVELNYLELKKAPQPRILPLVLDLTNPTPAIGWHNGERESFFQRGPVDLVMALALIHHLAIGNNLPLEDIARSFAQAGRYLLIEFVPKEDSQVQKLLRSRDDIFDQYHLEGFKQAFAPYFTFLKEVPIEGSARTLFLLQSQVP